MTYMIELRFEEVPAHWTLRDKRLAANIRRCVDDLRWAEARNGSKP
jgi:hypothetical protein